MTGSEFENTTEMERQRFRETNARIASRVFANLCHSLSQFDDQLMANVPVNLHILDSWESQSLCIGVVQENPLADTKIRHADAFDELVNDALSRIGVRGDEPVHIREVIAALDHLPDPEDVRSYLRLRGQPLTEKPTRLEQLLMIKQAQDKGVNLGGVADQYDPYIRDDYLEHDRDLDDIYRNAYRGLHEENPKEVHSETPVSRLNIPFLVAEQLQMAARGQRNGRWKRPKDFAEALEILAPQTAILPLRILGQWRGALGVFVLPEKDASIPKIEEIAEKLSERRELVETVFSQAIVNLASLTLFRSVANYSTSSRAPLYECPYAQRAFSYLWFSEGLGFSSGNAERVPTGRELDFKVRERLFLDNEFELKVGQASPIEAANHLGFDTVRYINPLPVSHAAHDHAKAWGEAIFANVTDAASMQAQNAELERKQQLRYATDLSTHDYANSLSELTSLMRPGLTSDWSAEETLSTAYSVARRLEGIIWIQRELGKRKIDGSESDLIAEILQLDPSASASAADFEFWKNQFLWHTRQTLMAQIMTNASEQSSPKAKVVLRLSISGKHVGEAHPVTTEYILDFDTKTDRVGAPPKTPLRLWPFMPGQVGDRLGKEGRTILFMLAGIELIRNAIKKCVEIAASGAYHDILPELAIEIEIAGTGRQQALRVRVTNPILDGRALEDIGQIKSLATLKILMGDRLEIRNLTVNFTTGPVVLEIIIKLGDLHGQS